MFTYENNPTVITIMRVYISYNRIYRYMYSIFYKCIIYNMILSCCLINVCGLKPKLLSPDFENFISQFDMLVLTETKMSDLDSTDNLFLDFDILYKNRKSAERASGGVALLTKKNISTYY